MIFERFEVPGLAHYSYAVGCDRTGEVAIVDPERNVERYLDWARRRGVRIGHVLETHIHADYASGAPDLAERARGKLLLSAHDDGERFEVDFAHEPLHDGEEIRLGAVRLQALHTPGHTPEHLSFLVFEEARSADVPEILLSGDFLFVGSLGRPDLLGEDAKRELAKQLFRSVREVLAELPDGLEIAPAHGSGSMCGSGMSGRPTSTLGFERVANPYLGPDLTEEEFIHRILGTVPPFPPYYVRMKGLNSAGAPRLDRLPPPERLGPGDFRALAESTEATVVDLRDAGAYGAGHVPGALNIGPADSFVTWAAWVVPYDRPILLVDEDEGRIDAARAALVRVGLDDVRAVLSGGMEAWHEAGLPETHIDQWTVSELRERQESGEPVRVLDVRREDEWETGHIPGAVHLMGGELDARIDEVPEGDDPLAVVCRTGYRSSVATGVLERHGFDRIVNVAGGMTAWQAAGYPTE